MQLPQDLSSQLCPVHAYLLILVELLLTLRTVDFDCLFRPFLAGLCLSYTRSAARNKPWENDPAFHEVQNTDLWRFLRTKL